ncbi:hypothetical protein A979_22737 [Pseudomonas syringae BRIP34876]|nr:hypothetical protein A979_22737 [Pseudomonas syringae BRIP34876]ELQ02811.1 hypothetical protein A987_11463 [Pseudomonas syringae BRIP34881]
MYLGKRCLGVYPCLTSCQEALGVSCVSRSFLERRSDELDDRTSGCLAYAPNPRNQRRIRICETQATKIAEAFQIFLDEGIWNRNVARIESQNPITFNTDETIERNYFASRVEKLRMSDI